MLGTRVIEVGRRLRGGLLLGPDEGAEGLCGRAVLELGSKLLVDGFVCLLLSTLASTSAMGLSLVLMPDWR